MVGSDRACLRKSLWENQFSFELAACRAKETDSPGEVLADFIQSSCIGWLLLQLGDHHMGQAVSTGLAVIGTAEINVRDRRGQLTIGIYH